MRISRRPHHEMLRKRRCLPEAEINLGLRRMRQVIGAAVAHYTDDLHRRPLPSVPPDLLADRNTVQKVAVDKRLVDHCDIGPAADIGGTEVPAHGNLLPQELEVSWRDRPQRYRNAVARLNGRRLSFDFDRS